MNCDILLSEDANEYIRRLEERNTWHESNEKYLASFMKDLSRQIEQLEAERDAAVEDMTKIVHESGESYCEYCHNWRGNTCPPYCRMHSEGFRWRGVQKEG